MAMLSNAAETATARVRRNTPTDVIMVSPVRQKSRKATETLDQNRALEAGAHDAALENERHAEQAASSVREVLEPYDE